MCARFIGAENITKESSLHKGTRTEVQNITNQNGDDILQLNRIIK